MDFKKLLNKLDSMDAPVATPAAPQIAPAVQLNEDAQLRVLSGRTTYVAEAKKKAEEDVKEEMKVGDKKASSTGGTIEKTATGVKHSAGKNYGGDKAPKDDEEDAPKAKKKTAKESIDTEAFKGKFAKMVEAKKTMTDKKKATKKMEEGAKPDFLDMDKDGDKKEPMKKAVADKKDGPKKGVNPFAKVKEGSHYGNEKLANARASRSGTSTVVDQDGKGGVKTTTTKTPAKKEVKEATKTDKPWTDMSGKKHSGTAVKGEKYTGKEADKETSAKKKTVKESVETKMSFRDMMKLVIESGGQQQIDPVDTALFAWAQRVAASKYTESTKAEVFAGMLYERNGGVFEMYDVLSEDQE